MIETDRLTKIFPGKEAVVDLDLRVQPAEILGFLGPNGAGTTTRATDSTARPPSAFSPAGMRGVRNQIHDPAGPVS